MKTGLKKEEIRRILAKGKRKRHGDITIVFEDGKQAMKTKKYAVIVTKKAAKNAVTRNRIKRIARETIRTSNVPFDRFVILCDRKERYTSEGIRKAIRDSAEKA